MKQKNIFAMGLLSSMLILNAPSYASTETQATFQNQRGSVMTLVWHETQSHSGNLTGTFTTAVGDCKAAINKPMPLTGIYTGTAVAITVNYPACNKVVAMMGNTNNQNSTLHTLWLVGANVTDPVKQNWNSNIVGSDDYKKIQS
jgi:hypothetical protein